MIAPRKPRASDSDSLLQAAYEAFLAGRRDQAEGLLRQVLDRDPGNTAAWNNLASLLTDSGRNIEAEAAYRKAIALNPGFPDFHSNLGNLLRATGRPSEAEDSYRQAIRLSPKDASNLALLAQLLKETGQTADAEKLFRQALALDPAYALGHNNLGILLKETDRPAEAEAAYRRALTLDPGFPEAHNNLGIVLLEDKRYVEAEAAVRRAVELKPDFADGYSNLGNILKQAERPDEAEAAYRHALELNPGFAEAHNNLGLLLKQANKGAEAGPCYRRALELKPDFAEAHNNLGILLLEDGHLAEAETAFRRAIELKPDFAEVHCNLGNLLKQDRRLAEAEAAYRRALEVDPEEVSAFNNLAILLSELLRFDEAEACFRRSVEIKPEFAEAHNNLGNLLKEMGRLQDAETAYRAALDIKDDFTDAKLNLGLLLLTEGRLTEGWPWHEARHFPDNKARRTMQPPFDFPQWRGEPLAGKSLVVVLEQGAGDNVQFVRYAPLLKARGLARLSFVQPGPFIPLVSTAQGIDFIANEAVLVPPHDYWCFPLSLPLHLGTTLDTIPDTLPYLWALPERVEKWRARLPATGPGGDIRVGLVWKGNPDHKNDANRSLSHLSVLAPLWQVPGISFVSLQKGQGEDEARQPPPGQPLLHLGDDIADFADTAAIVAQLDLVITVDSAAAHVAGALGKPVWVLLPGFGTDWRWLLEREDSPWYPGVMRLFRQPRGASSWNDTIRRLADALRTWVAAPPATRLPLLDNTAVPPSVSLASPFAPPAEEDAYAAALAAYQAGRHDEAEGILRGMLAGDPADAGCWNNLGNLLQETGRLDEAESAFGTAISLVPEQPSFHSNLGNLLVLGERLADAEAAYRRAIELDPGNAVAHNQLGSLLNKDGRPEEAAAAYRQALELAPDYADAHNNLGIVFKNAGNGTEAEAAYRLALQLNPGFAEAHNNLGILLLDDERFPEAETALRRALELKPDFPDVYSNLGNLLKQTHRLDEAEACYRRALELKPDDATAHNNLGVLLHEADQLNAAEAAYRHALELNPKFADARSNLGILLQRLRRYQEAEAAYRGAIELNPDCTDAKLNLGLMLLALGRYAEAWPWHEARHFPDNKARRTMQPPFDFPQWRGEPLAGKSLVVVLEQGAGDNVQFVRYAPLLKARGLARLSFVEPATLVTLLATARGVDAMVADVSTMPPHDFWCFPLSLPLHLGTTLDTIPDTLPYLWALPERVEKWRARLPAAGPGGDIRVGLVWKGNPDHKNDANRSLSHLSVLAPLWQVPGISFVSLQKGQGEDEARQPPPGQPLLHLGDDIADFADTAAIVAQLDLVITVDSAAAHVAGALGKPVWVLLPGFGTDWRWLLEREDSPWYPGVMRLFRQPRGASSWNDTIRRLADALRAWVAAPPATRLPLLDHPLAEISLPPALSPAADAPPEETEAGLRQAIARDPGDFRLQVDFAGFLKAAGRLDEAAAAFRAALDIEPDHLPTLALLAQVCKEARRLDAAEATYRRMIELDPRDIVTHNNLGNVLLEGKRVVAAEASFRRALDLDPHSEYTHSNLGNSLKAQNRLVEAEAAYRRALDLKPDSTGARLNLGFLLLALGRYAEAWPYHEDRFFRSRADRQAPDIGLSYPQWHGEPLAGKSLLVFTEQGNGDNVQFVRYAPLLKATGATRVTFVQPPALIPLLATAAGIDTIASSAGALQPHDYWVFPLSLPFHFGSTPDTLPATLPYLWALPERVEQWRPRLAASGPVGDIRVGLVWRGNPDHDNDANRSLPHLSVLAPLWQVPGISFVSLQKGRGEDEARQPPPGQPLLHLGDDIADFADTAAIIAQLDLVITVDSAAAHIAGALGKPVWLLLPGFCTDWRWLLERTDSPWYPGVMRLFRQPREASSWDDTIREMATALRIWSATPPALALPVSEQTLANLPAIQSAATPAPSGSAIDGLLQEAHTAYLAGRRDEAAARLREALALDPSNASAWNNLASTLAESGFAAEAEAAYRKAVGFAPTFVEPHINFAYFLNNLGRITEAAAAFRAAIALRPDDINLHNSLGAMQLNAGDAADAESAFRAALALDPGVATIWNNLGNALKTLGRPREAEAAYREALLGQPDDNLLLNNLAVVLSESGRATEALALLRRITTLAPYYPDAWNNFGTVLQQEKHFAEAETAYRKAIAIHPGFAAAHGNLANLLATLQHLPEAEIEYRRATALDPNFISAHWNLAVLLLNQGRWAEAWPWFDRRNDPFRPLRNETFGCPEWRGEDLTGKSMLIDSVEGQGDNIMCARYVHLLKAAGASRITLLHRQSLKPLLETVRGVDAVVHEPPPAGRHDFWCFSFSLLARFDTTPANIPAPIPYVFPLEPRVSYWRRRLAPVGGFRVGLVWKGDPANDVDRHRSLPHLATLAPLWQVPGVSFVSLQKGRGEEEARLPPPGQPLVNFGDDIADFADTAAIISELDLLITVDTAAAHVAGALGKPVWVLLPDIGTDWRWLQEREDTPWYPGVMRLFRQSRQAPDWQAVIGDLTAALAASTGGKSEAVHAPAAPAAKPSAETALRPFATESSLEPSMTRPSLRPAAFVLASSDHGTLIVNRNDYADTGGGNMIGVGCQVLFNSSFDRDEVDLALRMLDFRRRLFGDGVMALDCGANIGVHTVEWAKQMHGWGSVIAVEAQERVFYALAGNITINNCFNARAIWGAVGAENGEIIVPRPDYLRPGSYGSMEIRPSVRNEFIGQPIDYSEESGVKTRLFTIDSLALPRVDFIKIDIEGMEMEALAGAMGTIRKFRPQMIIEKIKSDETALRNLLIAEGYRVAPFTGNLVAIHGSDPSHEQLLA